MRSLTYSPLSLRKRCTRLTSSRASPSRLRASVSVGSMAAKRVPSCATTSAPLALRTTVRSSASSGCEWPPTVRCTASPRSNASSVALCSAFTAWAASGVSLPHFLPNDRKLAFASSDTSESADPRNSTPFTFSSLASSGASWSSKSCSASPATHTSRDSGCRTLMPASSRAARPSVASARTSAMAVSSAVSRAPGLARTKSARCTEAPASARWIQSLTKGANGASSRETTINTSCSVANAARLSALSTS